MNVDIVVENMPGKNALHAERYVLILKKHNHYARMCRSKSVHDVQQKVNDLNLRTMTFLLEQLIMRAETNY